MVEHKHPVWFDDIIIVTEENMEKLKAVVRETVTQLVQAEYKLNPKISFSKKKSNGWDKNRPLNHHYRVY